MSWATRLRGTADPPMLRRGFDAGREVLLLGVLYLLYRAARLVATGHEAQARANADKVRSFEAWLPLPSEAGLQHGAAAVPHLLQLANVYYVGVHFPITIAFLVWGYVRRPRAEYVWARNLLVVLTGLSVVIEFLFPLAPPRMFPQWSFVDTMATIGPSAYDGVGGTLANQYAAMPSLHIGWALTLAVVVHRTGPAVLRVLTKLHATATIVVVVITANHWWVDGIVVAVLLVAAVRVVPLVPQTGGLPGRRRTGSPA